MPKHPKVFLLITDAGGGHRASANSLKAACEAQKAPLDIRIINMYREVWQNAEPLGRVTGIYGEDIYNFTLKHSLLRLAPHLRTMGRWAAKAPNQRSVLDGVAFLNAERPALCVSLMPFVNDTLARICAMASTPFALVMTDLVDVKPFMWYTPEACRDAEWVAAPCDESAAQAREAGATRVLESGLLLHPKYYDPGLRGQARLEARRKLGLKPDCPTVLLSMGGYGGSAMEDLVLGLERHGQGFQILAVCGRNEALQKRLQARPKGRHHVVALGFTQDLQHYLRAADLMAGKPGPASIFEAMATATPMVLDAEAAMPQEAPNARLAEANGWALSVRRRRDMPAAVAGLLENAAARATMEAAQRAKPLADGSKILVEALLESVEKNRGRRFQGAEAAFHAGAPLGAESSRS